VLKKNKSPHAIEPTVKYWPECRLHLYAIFFLSSGVQTAQGAGTDGPTLTDITAGESMSSGAVQVDGVDKMSSVLPTMWLGAQSGW